MQALETRIAKLEQASPATNTEPVFIHLVAMGSEGAEIQRIKKGGLEWQRQPSESIHDLKARAMREVTPPLAGCRTVFLCY